MTQIRLLIVEDHDFFRQTLTMLLAADERIAVVGAVSSVGQALPLLHTLRPDVVLLDLNLPHPSGLALLESLPPGSDRPDVLVLTGADDAQSVHDAFAAGAHGYLRKDAIHDDLLVSAIFAVAHGGVFVDMQTFAILFSA